MWALKEESLTTLDAYMWQASEKGQLVTNYLAHLILLEKHNATHYGMFEKHNATHYGMFDLYLK